MYNTIMIPIDIAHVEKAKIMIEAAKIQASKDAKIIMLTVIDAIPGWAASFVPDNDALSKPLQAAQDELASIASANSIEADIQVRTGHSYNTILEVAKETKTDLIIVASHHPGYGDYVLGSTATKVVRHAKCSVFVIR